MKIIKFLFKVNTFIVVTYTYAHAVQAIMNWNMFVGGISSVVLLIVASILMYGMFNVLDKRYNDKSSKK